MLRTADARESTRLAEPGIDKIIGQLHGVTKLAGVLFLTGWHYYLMRAQKRFASGERVRSERFWRMTNELPFVAAIIMVLAITTKFAF